MRERRVIQDCDEQCVIHDWIEIYDDQDGFITICRVCGEDL